MGTPEPRAAGYERAGARYYDPAYAPEHGASTGRQADVEFYRRLAAELGGPVLELGCGTGRALLPVAADGIECVGLDASAEMLEVLRAKNPPSTMRLVQSPMQRFDLGDERFALVFSAFRPLQHLLEVDDQLACLECVTRHLAPGGTFAFDVFNPRFDMLAANERDAALDVSFEYGGQTVERWSLTRPDRLRQVIEVEFRYLVKDGERVVDEVREQIAMRWFHRFELEHLLARAGFADVTIYGDFDRSPLTAASPEYVVLARP